MAVRGGVGLHPVVERLDARHRPQRRLRHGVAARRWYSLTGVMLASTTLMPCACASSLIDARLPSISSFGHRPGVAGDVVGAGEDDDRLRLQIDDVAAGTA